MQTSLTHTTVLLQEAVDALVTDADETYVDATFGRGGHSRLILSRLSRQGRLVAFDKDPAAVAEGERLDDARFSIRHQGFRHLGDLPPASVTSTERPAVWLRADPVGRATQFGSGTASNIRTWTAYGR